MSFAATVSLDGTTYNLLKVSMKFSQKFDERGVPTSSVYTEWFDIFLYVNDDEKFIGWMANPYAKKSLEINFMKMEDESSALKLSLENAYCVGYKSSFNTSADLLGFGVSDQSFDEKNYQGTITRVTIAAGKISYGQATLDLKW